LPRLIARLGEDPWPDHVRDELYAAVACGDPEEGFLWVSCDDCGVHRLVAVSCKGRGFRPRCGGRRMAQGAANLVDDLLPRVPVRQWVLSMPMREASYGYFSLEAGSRTGAEDRRGLERLCRYILRPAVPLSRLGVDGEDRVVLTLRHPWRDVTTALRFEAETSS